MGTHTCQQPAAVLQFLLARLFTKNSQKAQPEREVSMPLQLLTVIVLGLMCGSGMNIAVFGHPTLNKQPLEVHIPVRASFAKLFGRVMPFWMGASTLLNLLLLLPFGHSNRFVWRTDAIALTIQLAAVGFSLIGPVPINNRIARRALLPFLVTGVYRSIAGTSAIGSEHQG
jgi:hypothetical protein